MWLFSRDPESAFVFFRRTVVHNNMHMVCFSSYYCVRDGEDNRVSSR